MLSRKHTLRTKQKTLEKNDFVAVLWTAALLKRNHAYHNRMKEMKLSFQMAIICIFLPLILLSIIVIGVSAYSMVEKNQMNLICNSARSVLDLTNSYLSNRLSGMVAELMSIYNSNELSQMIYEVGNFGSINPSSLVAMQNVIQSIFNRNYSDFSMIAIAFEKKESLMIYSGYYQAKEIIADWSLIEEKNADTYSLRWRNANSESLIKVDGNTHPSIGIYLYGFSPIGGKFVIYIDVSDRAFMEAYRNLLELGPSFVMLDAEGEPYRFFEQADKEILSIPYNIEYDGDSGVIYKDGNAFIYGSIPINRWKTIVCFSDHQLLFGLDSIRNIIILMVLLVGGSAVVMVFVSGKLIAGPLKRFSVQVSELDVDKLEGFQFDNLPTFSSEVTILRNNMNSMLVRLQNLIEDIEKRQEENLKMQNSLLLSQINPHFLYNTLYAIAQECSIGETTEASEMLFDLSAFFRLGLNSGKELVCIQDEIDHACSYLKLISKSFPYRLEYEVNISDEYRHYIIPRMTFQPIVENCFKHGLKGRRGDGRIVFSLTENPEFMMISISDNGIGMTKEHAMQISTFFESESHDSKSFGLFNVNKRIKNYFGADCGLTISSEMGLGTTVLIKIKKRLGEDDE